MPLRLFAASPLEVNASRLRQTLEELSVFGRPVGGTFADGVSRVAYSDADAAGRKYVVELMEARAPASRVAGITISTAKGHSSDQPLRATSTPTTQPSLCATLSEEILEQVTANRRRRQTGFMS